MTSELVAKRVNSELVVRSTDVPANLPYGKCKPWLRSDFIFQCAYCTMSEAEAQGIRFTIDHYEPQSARPDLVDQYDNLMYCCDQCNELKGDRVPPPTARDNGVRYFRPDTDRWREHFERQGVRINGRSPAGEFSIQAIDLNRQRLRKLRELRKRVAQCDEEVSEGITALRRFPLDRLNQKIRSRVSQRIGQATDVMVSMVEAIDQVLRESAKSELLDEESAPELKERNRERQAFLKEKEALYPGTWRGRKPKKANSSSA